MLSADKFSSNVNTPAKAIYKMVSLFDSPTETFTSESKCIELIFYLVKQFISGPKSVILMHLKSILKLTSSNNTK